MAFLGMRLFWSNPFSFLKLKWTFLAVSHLFASLSSFTPAWIFMKSRILNLAQQVWSPLLTLGPCHSSVASYSLHPLACPPLKRLAFSCYVPAFTHAVPLPWYPLPRLHQSGSSHPVCSISIRIVGETLIFVYLLFMIQIRWDSTYSYRFWLLGLWSGSSLGPSGPQWWKTLWHLLVWAASCIPQWVIKVTKVWEGWCSGEGKEDRKGPRMNVPEQKLHGMQCWICSMIFQFYILYLKTRQTVFFLNFNTGTKLLCFWVSQTVFLCNENSSRWLSITWEDS